MRKEVTRLAFAWVFLALISACKPPLRTRPDADAQPSAPVPSSFGRGDGGGVHPAADSGLGRAEADAGADHLRPIGPYELPFDGTRTVFYVVPRATRGPHRLLANLHGVCNPPGYACGFWVSAASHAGFLVCPTGNSRCGNSPLGSPTWTEPIAKIDADLEKAIAVVDARHPNEMNREGSVLTGFSLGASAAVQIARNHPGRWPYLIIVEADVALEVAQLRTAGIKAIALLAGENGSQLAGERRTAARLAKQGFPARLWVMKGAGHHYSADIDALMAEALAFVLAEGVSPDAGAPQ